MNAAIRLPDGGLYPEKGCAISRATVHGRGDGDPYGEPALSQTATGRSFPDRWSASRPGPARSRVVAVVPQRGDHGRRRGRFCLQSSTRPPSPIAACLARRRRRQGECRPIGARARREDRPPRSPVRRSRGEGGPSRRRTGRAGRRQAELAQESDFDLETLEDRLARQAG